MPFMRKRLQRRVLTIIQNHDGVLSTREVAAEAYALPPDPQGHCEVPDAYAHNVRAVLLRLSRLGLIADLGHDGPDRHRRWASCEAGRRFRSHGRVPSDGDRWEPLRSAH